MTVHYQETLQLEISLQNFTRKDSLIAFQILMKVGQQKEKTVITAIKDGTTNIQRIKTNPTIFGDRLSANFSKAEQMITIFLRRMEFKDDGLKFISKLDYTTKLGYIHPPPSVTTTISVSGIIYFNPFMTEGDFHKRLLKLQSNMQLCSSVTS